MEALKEDLSFQVNGSSSNNSCSWWQMILLIEDEIARSKTGGFRLLHPIKESGSFYTSLFRNPRFSDHLLTRWLEIGGIRGKGLGFLPAEVRSYFPMPKSSRPSSSTSSTNRRPKSGSRSVHYSSPSPLSQRVDEQLEALDIGTRNSCLKNPHLGIAERQNSEDILNILENAQSLLISNSRILQEGIGNSSRPGSSASLRSSRKIKDVNVISTADTNDSTHRKLSDFPSADPQRAEHYPNHYSRPSTTINKTNDNKRKSDTDNSDITLNNPNISTDDEIEMLFQNEDERKINSQVLNHYELIRRYKQDLLSFSSSNTSNPLLQHLPNELFSIYHREKQLGANSPVIKTRSSSTPRSSPSHQNIHTPPSTDRRLQNVQNRTASPVNPSSGYKTTLVPPPRVSVSSQINSSNTGTESVRMVNLQRLKKGKQPTSSEYELNEYQNTNTLTYNSANSKVTFFKRQSGKLVFRVNQK
jgi:hypothetical protein